LKNILLLFLFFVSAFSVRCCCQNKLLLLLLLQHDPSKQWKKKSFYPSTIYLPLFLHFFTFTSTIHSLPLSSLPLFPSLNLLQILNIIIRAFWFLNFLFLQLLIRMLFIFDY
ncbi:hypothetical protein T08_369, partial [Trichinella sp. T8]